MKAMFARRPPVKAGLKPSRIGGNSYEALSIAIAGIFGGMPERD